eukprot:358103-Chlamydomonas_euryale.AAC.1
MCGGVQADGDTEHGRKGGQSKGGGEIERQGAAAPDRAAYLERLDGGGALPLADVSVDRGAAPPPALQQLLDLCCGRRTV